ncbi:hypothetical protein PCANC_07138 [Puccinia coronata f. sp. avenae]|uniref:Uncharacterized protein n=1 Tax=Puccinia coronata f. sp. avenae TaxID=200324 RepID=A0A2N5VIP9_9BASI|nr:hypothetical protein PCANC_07138 [Puccinia coronata f. sp. avenae]
MAYDVYGSSFSKLAGPNSPLYSTCSEPTKKYSVAQTIKQMDINGYPLPPASPRYSSYGYAYTAVKLEDNAESPIRSTRSDQFAVSTSCRYCA